MFILSFIIHHQILWGSKRIGHFHTISALTASPKALISPWVLAALVTGWHSVYLTRHTWILTNPLPLNERGCQTQGKEKGEQGSSEVQIKTRYHPASLNIQPLLRSPTKKFVPEWAEHCFAGWPATKHRFILHRWQVKTLLQWGQKTGQGDNHPCGLQPAGRPHIPAETDSITLLVLLDELQVRRHGTAALKGRKQHAFRQRSPVWTTVLQRRSADQLHIGMRHCWTKPIHYKELIPLSNEPCDYINLFCPVLSSTFQTIKTPPNPMKKQGNLTLKARMQVGFFSSDPHLTFQYPLSLMLASRQSCLTRVSKVKQVRFAHVLKPSAKTLGGKKKAKSETKTLITNVTWLPA